VPGLAVFFEFSGAAAGAAGIEIQHEASFDDGGRDQIPNVMRLDEGSEEVDVVRGVGLDVPVTAPVTADAEGLVAVMGRELYLDAPDADAGVDHDVVVFVVAKRLADGEASAMGLEHELHFGLIAAVLRVSLG